MADEFVASLLGGLVWLGGGLAFSLLRSVCRREIEAIRGARRVKHIRELVGAADESTGSGQQRLVAVVGQVNSESPITCKNSRVPAVILEESVEQFFLKQATGNNWVKDSTFLVGSKQQAPWFLEDNTGRAYVEGAQSAVGFSLVLASDAIEEPSPSNTVRALADVAQGIRVLFIRRVERVLPVGTTLTVIGEVVKTGQQKITIRRPQWGGPFFVSTKDIESLISTLGTSSAWCMWLSVGCTAVGLITMAFHGVKFFFDQRRSGYRRPGAGRPRSRNEEQAPDGISPGENDADAANTSCCVICLDKEYNVAFFPCGHVCCCKDCIENLQNCPLCRKRISQRKIVFLH